MPNFTREMDATYSITINTATAEDADELLEPVWRELQENLSNGFFNSDGLQDLRSFNILAKTHPEIITGQELFGLQPSPEIVDTGLQGDDDEPCVTISRDLFQRMKAVVQDAAYIGAEDGIGDLLAYIDTLASFAQAICTGQEWPADRIKEL